MVNITSATGIAIIAIILIDIFSLGRLTFGLYYAIGAAMIFAGIVAAGPLNTYPCKPYTATCQ
jgi:hypothetical protein